MNAVQKVVVVPPSVLWGRCGRTPSLSAVLLPLGMLPGLPSFADRTLCLLIILSSVKYFFMILLNLLLALRPHASILASGRLQLATNLLHLLQGLFRTQLSHKDVHDTVSSKQDVKAKEEWRAGLQESGTYFSGGPCTIPHGSWASYL